MLDIKFIKDNPDKVRETLKIKNCRFDMDGFLALEEKRRKFIKESDDLRAQQNKLSEEAGRMIKEKKDASEIIALSKEAGAKIASIDAQSRDIKKEFDSMLLSIPNIPHASVPFGGPECNKIVKTWGKPAQFDFKALDHTQLAEKHDLIDFKRATKITGSNFLLFKGNGARLERALINFMLDLHTREHGYTEVSPAFVANRQSMTATGQLPKLQDDMYHIKEDDLFLIPTAEVPVTNIHRDEVLEESSLPRGYAAYSACFRREAGSYGKDTRGMIRVHQFDKVELVKFVKPENSYDELEKLVVDACRVLESLDIHYRVVMLAAGDMSFAAAKCYDIEIYAPGMDKWLEVSSCSNFEDFQARRGNIKYREKETGKLRFVHTLNGSGVALPRLAAVIMESYQQKDSTIMVPEILRRYMNGSEKL